MADFEIDVGFNTQELMDATGGGRGGTSEEQKAINNVGLGVSKGIKIAGLVGILSGLALVTDTIGFFLGIIGGSITFLVGQFVQFAVPFFTNFERSILGLGLSIVNGFLTGIEFLINTISAALNLIPGVDIPQIELPRFQEGIVFEAFDELQSVLEDSEASAEQLKIAEQNYVNSFVNSFLTEEEFQKVKSLAEAANISLAEALVDVEASGSIAEGFISNSVDVTIRTASSAFDKLNEALVFIENRARDILGQGATSFDIRSIKLTSAEALESPQDVLARFNKQTGQTTG